MYYKLIEGEEVIQVFVNEGVDEFLDLRNRFGEDNVEEITEEEYTEYKEKFEKEDVDTSKDMPVFISGTVQDLLDSKKITEQMNLKIYIFNSFFQNQYALPTIEELEDYYNWLKK